MSFIAAILALLSGVAAALVVCRAVQFTLLADTVLGLASLYLMSKAAHLAGDHVWPLATVAVGYLLAVLAMRRNRVRTVPLSQMQKDFQ